MTSRVNEGDGVKSDVLPADIETDTVLQQATLRCLGNHPVRYDLRASTRSFNVGVPERWEAWCTYVRGATEPPGTSHQQTT